MSRGDGLKFKNMDQWLKWLATAEKDGVDRCKSRILRSAGMAGLEYAQDNTPRRSSRLAQSLSVGAQENYFELKIGKVSHVVYGTNVEYAAAVENGISEEGAARLRGKFIPGYWQGDTFHYDRSAKGGMVLKGLPREGAHMLQKSLDYLEDGPLEDITLFELKRLYAELK